MNNKLKIKLFEESLKDKRIEAYYSQYVARARAAVKRHNAEYPDDQWTFHGGYIRILIFWNFVSEEWEEFALKIIRIRTKNRTFAFQDGLFLLRTQ